MIHKTIGDLNLIVTPNYFNPDTQTDVTVVKSGKVLATASCVPNKVFGSPKQIVVRLMEGFAVEGVQIRKYLK